MEKFILYVWETKRHHSARLTCLDLTGDCHFQRKAILNTSRWSSCLLWYCDITFFVLNATFQKNKITPSLLEPHSYMYMYMYMHLSGSLSSYLLTHSYLHSQENQCYWQCYWFVAQWQILPLFVWSQSVSLLNLLSSTQDTIWRFSVQFCFLGGVDVVFALMSH